MEIARAFEMPGRGHQGGLAIRDPYLRACLVLAGHEGGKMAADGRPGKEMGSNSVVQIPLV